MSDCETCRIAVTTDGIVVGLLVLVSAMYVGKKWVDKKFK